ncbi:MAG: hypothetical protein ACPGVU_22345, partial [Limisphaerales bacterium]
WEKMQHEEIMAARQAFDGFRDRLLDLRMEHLDDPDQAVKKARVLLGSGQCNTILALGGGFRDALLAEIARDDWMYEAFVDAQPDEVRSMAVREQIRPVLHWLQSEGEPGSHVVFECRDHEAWIQMQLRDGGEVEFDFPFSIRSAPGQAGPMDYERVSELPEIADAEETRPFDNRQVAAVRAVLQTLGLAPNILRMLSRNPDGEPVGAIESLTFRVPVTATEMFEQLIPALFQAVHGVENLGHLEIQTG